MQYLRLTLVNLTQLAYANSTMSSLTVTVTRGLSIIHLIDYTVVTTTLHMKTWPQCRTSDHLTLNKGRILPAEGGQAKDSPY